MVAKAPQAKGEFEFLWPFDVCLKPSNKRPLAPLASLDYSGPPLAPLLAPPLVLDASRRQIGRGRHAYVRVRVYMFAYTRGVAVASSGCPHGPHIVLVHIIVQQNAHCAE